MESRLRTGLGNRPALGWQPGGRASGHPVGWQSRLLSSTKVRDTRWRMLLDQSAFEEGRSRSVWTQGRLANRLLKACIPEWPEPLLCIMKGGPWSWRLAASGKASCHHDARHEVGSCRAYGCIRSLAASKSTTAYATVCQGAAGRQSYRYRVRYAAVRHTSAVSFDGHRR